MSFSSWFHRRRGAGLDEFVKWNFSKLRSCQAPEESDGEEGNIGEDEVVWDEAEVSLMQCEVGSRVLKIVFLTATGTFGCGLRLLYCRALVIV